VQIETGPVSPPVVVVTGPTAAGKSALALRLAQHFDGEIVNADSMQVYRGMDIGTAKPTRAERARVAHHLIDVVTPDVQYNAARFAAEGAEALAAIAARGRCPLVTGGTGLYIRALLEGLGGGVGADPQLRRELEEEHARAVEKGDGGRLHRQLARIDPESAGRLHPNDVRRIVRALEIHALTGEPASQRRSSGPPAPRYRVLHLAVDPGREALAERISRRCEQMIEQGLLREVRRLREEGYGPELPSMQAIGYRHVQAVIDGADTLANVLERLKIDTRQFARRQRTWLRALPGVVWMHPNDWDAVRSVIDAFLADDPARSGEEEAAADRTGGEGAGA